MKIEILLLIALGVVFSIAGTILLNKLWNRLSNEKQKLPTWMIGYAAVIAAGNILIIMAKQSIYAQTDVYDIVRDMIIVSLLWIAAATDKKYYKIPNAIILSGLACWIIITIIEAVENEMWLVHIISELIAAGIVVIIVGICLLLMKNSIGMGDLKLLIIMAAYFGIPDIFTAVFFSLIISFAGALVLLIRKEKSRHDTMSFAPFLLAGTITAIILTGI